MVINKILFVLSSIFIRVVHSFLSGPVLQPNFEKRKSTTSLLNSRELTGTWKFSHREGNLKKEEKRKKEKRKTHTVGKEREIAA